MVTIKTLQKELLTQDNLGTSNPYWVIMDYKKIPSSQDYSDKYIWISDGSEFTDEEVKEYLKDEGIDYTEDSFESIAEKNEFEKMWYIEVETEAEVFLTKKGAEIYFNNRRYNFSKKAHLYCKSAYYSFELKYLQESIKKGLKFNKRTRIRI